MKRARKITKKEIKEIAKKYDLDPVEIQDINQGDRKEIRPRPG